MDDAQKYKPLLAVDGINTPDNDPYNFELQIAEGEVFEVSYAHNETRPAGDLTHPAAVQLFGFLPDGSGKALSLTRTVMTPLPTATNCLRNVQTK